MSEWRCIGCGGPLQNTDPDAPFYTPKTYEKNVPIYCERCYKIRHYGQIKPSFVSESVILNTLSTVEKRPGILVLVADALDFYGSMHPYFNELSHHKRTLLIVNKIDVLPKSKRREKMRHAYLAMAQDQGLSVDKIMLVSALKKTEIDTMIERMLALSMGQDITLVGVSNVGKSSILNAILGAQTGQNNQVTTSFESQITQGLIPFRLKDQTLYDTPGLSSHHSYRYYVSGESLRMIMPFKEIKPIVFQSVAGRSFFIGGFAYVSFDADQTGQMVSYFANPLTIHARNDAHPEHFYESKVGHLLNPPAVTDPSVPMVTHDVRISEPSMSCFFPGLGFIRLQGITQMRVTTYDPVPPIMHEGMMA